jgi:hypothetical protein
MSSISFLSWGIMIKYLKRRMKHSYNQLWTMVYGYEQDKGLLREVAFYAEAANAWKTSYEVVKKDNDRLNKKIQKLSGHQE